MDRRQFVAKIKDKGKLKLKEWEQRLGAGT